MEQQDYTKEVFQLSQEIESGFTKFSRNYPFDRDSIVLDPAGTIELGLTHLECLSAISKEECREHLSNFDWGTLRLEDAIQDATKKELLEALVHNLEFWYKRYSGKMDEVVECED